MHLAMWREREETAKSCVCVCRQAKEQTKKKQYENAFAQITERSDWIISYGYQKVRDLPQNSQCCAIVTNASTTDPRINRINHFVNCGVVEVRVKRSCNLPFRFLLNEFFASSYIS